MTDYEKMQERNDPEGLRDYYVTRDGERVDYDPETVQPPVVYGDPPFTTADISDTEEIDPDGLIVHESHGEYEEYPGDAVDPTPMAEVIGHTPVTVDAPEFARFSIDGLNGYGRDLRTADLYQSELAPENGKFHIRYYGVVEHSQFAPPDPDCGNELHHGLVSLGIRGMGDNHLHTDLHTFNPLSLLAEGSCPPGSKVRVDIQDFENVILEYIHNYPRQLGPDDVYPLDDTYMELGQWDGNKKMTLEDFLKVVDREFPTDLGSLSETLAKVPPAVDWIAKVPTQVGVTLGPDDGVCLPYSHLPKPYVKGEFEWNPATRIGTLRFDYVDYVLIPPASDPRIFQMRSPKLLGPGTVPESVRPSETMRLTAFAEATVRTGGSEVVDEDRDSVDLAIFPDGSVGIDGSIWLQHHEVGRPGVKENDRWRVEVSTRGGVIML